MKGRSAVERDMRRKIADEWTSDAPVRVLVGLVLIGLVLAASASKVQGQTGTASGSTLFTFGAAVADDLSNYTLYYTVPQVIHVGVKTNMTFYVYVTLLSGWKIQSQTQILEIIINTPTRQVVTQHAQNNVTLYQGGRWGPFNMTFDINDSQAGLSPGQLTGATVYADLVVYEAFDDPASPFVQDSGTSLPLTPVQIAATPGSSSPSDDRLLASVFVGATVVTALTGVALATRKKSRPSA